MQSNYYRIYKARMLSSPAHLQITHCSRQGSVDLQHPFWGLLGALCCIHGRWDNLFSGKSGRHLKANAKDPLCFAAQPARAARASAQSCPTQDGRRLWTASPHLIQRHFPPTVEFGERDAPASQMLRVKRASQLPGDRPAC